MHCDAVRSEDSQMGTIAGGLHFYAKRQYHIYAKRSGCRRRYLAQPIGRSEGAGLGHRRGPVAITPTKERYPILLCTDLVVERSLFLR